MADLGFWTNLQMADTGNRTFAPTLWAEIFLYAITGAFIQGGVLALLASASLHDYRSRQIFNYHWIGIAFLWFFSVSVRTDPLMYVTDSIFGACISSGIFLIAGKISEKTHVPFLGKSGLLIRKDKTGVIVGRKTMGMGDVKVLFACGLFLGRGYSLTAVFLACIIGLSVMAAGKGKSGIIPFIPAIAMATVICLIYSDFAGSF